MPILQFFLQNAQATSGGVVSLVENWGKKETKQHIERREAEESMNKNRISGSVESHQTWVPFYCFFSEDLRLDVAGAERCAARLGEELLFSTEDLYQLTEKAGPGGLSSHGILVHRGCWEVAWEEENFMRLPLPMYLALRFFDEHHGGVCGLSSSCTYV